jgi:hypothetical protein
MVPWTIVPFLSSIVTVSLFNFIKNLHKRQPHAQIRAEIAPNRSANGSESSRGKEGEPRALAYLTSFILEASDGRGGSGGKS